MSGPNYVGEKGAEGRAGFNYKFPNMSVELLHATPLSIAVGAIRQCYESFENSDSGLVSKGIDAPLAHVIGPKDKALIERIISSGHTSTLEHISFNFQIKGISRLNLQELARHRMASLSVKSSRYTLSELKKEDVFLHKNPKDEYFAYDYERASKYINLTGIKEIDECSCFALENLRRLVQAGYKNDESKYALPESFKTNLYWTVNCRSLRNFIQLRYSKQAHFEIRELAKLVYINIPDSYKFLLSGAYNELEDNL